MLRCPPPAECKDRAPPETSAAAPACCAIATGVLRAMFLALVPPVNVPASASHLWVRGHLRQGVPRSAQGLSAAAPRALAQAMAAELSTHLVVRPPRRARTGLEPERCRERRCWRAPSPRPAGGPATVP